MEACEQIMKNYLKSEPEGPYHFQGSQFPCGPTWGAYHGSLQDFLEHILG